MFRRRTVRRDCPDGSSIVLYRNPADAFPLALKKTVAKADAAVEGLNNMKLTAGLEVSREIDVLLVRIGRASGQFQSDLAAIYQAYSFDPCSDRDYFKRELHDLLTARRHQETALLRAEMAVELLRLGSPVEDVRAILREAIGFYNQPSVASAPIQQVNAEREVERWQQQTRPRPQ